MKKILIGTGNKAKINTYKKLLGELDFEVISSKDLDLKEPEELGSTFEEVAIDKAKYYFEKTGIPVIVDDGGFVIEALNGEPGVKSKRWIGREMTDEEIIAEVIKRMEGIKERSCKHVVVLGLATPFGIFTSHGEVVGVVAEQASEKRIPGYPYRPVMYLPNYGKYWIDLTDEEEDILNHRRQALENLSDILRQLS